MTEDLISLEKTHLLPLYFKLTKKFKAYAGEKTNLHKLQEAYVFGLEMHKDQKRDSGEPYFTHPLNTALLLTEYEADLETLIAALLHDVIEKAEDFSLLKQIEAKFGKKVAFLVEGLTPVKGPSQEMEIQNLKRLFRFAEEDMRIIFIKLMDRLHNLRTLSSKKDKEVQKYKAQESIRVYVPIASQIGLPFLTKEFVKLAKPYIEDRIKNKVDYYGSTPKTKAQLQVVSNTHKNKLPSTLSNRFLQIIDNFESAKLCTA